jgi:glycogen debranching enzyme
MKIFLTLITTFVICGYLYINHKNKNVFKKYNKTIVNKRKHCIKLAFDTIYQNRRDGLMILAGQNYYSDMWTRDAFITSLGLFASEKNMEIIKNILAIQSKNIRIDGLVPLRIGKKSYITRFLLGFHSGEDNVPVYEDDKAFSEPTDSNPQFIIMSWLYYKFTNDIKFINSISDKILLCYNYMLKCTKNKLLQGKFFHSWYDTFAFDGPDLFSNVLYVYSIKCFNNLVNLNQNIKYNNLKFEYDEILSIFKKQFWNGEYLKISPNINVMETAGNSLAILLNILNSNESISVMNYIDKNNEYKIMPVTIPKIPKKYLWSPAYIVGMEGYHNDRLWLWPHNIYMGARKKLNLKLDYNNIENVTCKYNMFFENLNYQLEPYTHWFQNTEKHFSESCGSYLFSLGNVNFF